MRLRIAPSPTGYPHIGTIYQALFNYAYAKKNEGSFIVRIEDTDRSRFVEGAEDVIFASLDWVGLTEDESPRKAGEFGPYRQSERLEQYHHYAEELIAKGHAYYSYFPKKDAGQKKDYTEGRKEVITESSESALPTSIKEMMERGDFVVRMNVPKEGTVTFKDGIRGEISFPVKEITEQVLIKSDGFPTYHLAVVVDDHLMGITHIVRGEEWVSSTPKHVLLYQYFGWDVPFIYHTPDLRNPDKSKLSKRQGHTNVTWYREEGYLPEALLNFLALQGWSHPEEKELFSLKEFISVFDLKDMKPVGPIFDLTKLTWMNQQYIQSLDNNDLKKKLLTYYNEDKVIYKFLSTNKNVAIILDLVKTRMKTLKEFSFLVSSLFNPPKKEILNEEHFSVIPKLIHNLENVSHWKKDEIFQAIKLIMSENRSAKMPLFYIIFTGSKQGLPLPDMLEVLEKDEVLQRLKSLIS